MRRFTSKTELLRALLTSPESSARLAMECTLSAEPNGLKNVVMAAASWAKDSRLISSIDSSIFRSNASAACPRRGPPVGCPRAPCGAHEATSCHCSFLLSCSAFCAWMCSRVHCSALCASKG